MAFEFVDKQLAELQARKAELEPFYSEYVHLSQVESVMTGAAAPKAVAKPAAGRGRGRPPGAKNKPKAAAAAA